MNFGQLAGPDVMKNRPAITNRLVKSICKKMLVICWAKSQPLEIGKLQKYSINVVYRNECLI